MSTPNTTWPGNKNHNRDKLPNKTKCENAFEEAFTIVCIYCKGIEVEITEDGIKVCQNPSCKRVWR